MFTRDFRTHVLAMSSQFGEKGKERLGYHDNVGQLENDAEQKKPDTHVLTLHDSIHGKRKNR